MGIIPYELLVPLGQLKSLNLSGNHLVNVSMQILHPVNNLDVSVYWPLWRRKKIWQLQHKNRYEQILHVFHFSLFFILHIFVEYTAFFLTINLSCGSLHLCHSTMVLYATQFFSTTQLLDLSRNQLNGIEDSQTMLLQKIREVRLENNPLICDRCHMGSLIQIAKNVSSIYLVIVFWVFLSLSLSRFFSSLVGYVCCCPLYVFHSIAFTTTS